MLADIPDDLTDLLQMWWLAERRAGLAHLGLPRECPTTRGYQPRYRGGADDDDDSVRRTVVQIVATAVAALPDGQRSAVHMLARDLASGVSVWRSNRADDGALCLAVVALCHRLAIDFEAVA